MFRLKLPSPRFSVWQDRRLWVKRPFRVKLWGRWSGDPSSQAGSTLVTCAVIKYAATPRPPLAPRWGTGGGQAFTPQAPVALHCWSRTPSSDIPSDTFAVEHNGTWVLWCLPHTLTEKLLMEWNPSTLLPHQIQANSTIEDWTDRVLLCELS